MTAALALDTDKLQRISGLPAKPVLRQAATFLADLVKPGAPDPPGEFDADRVGGYFDDLEEADAWARHFYEAWVEGLTPEEYSALDEYKKEGFRSLNRGLRDHDGDLSMLPPEDAAGPRASMRPWRRPRHSKDRLWSTADGCRTRCSKRSRPTKRRPSLTRCSGISPTRVPRSVAVWPGSTAGAPASQTASARSRCHGGRRPAAWRYYDENGNRISKEEWRELGRRKAEKRKRAKSAG